MSSGHVFECRDSGIDPGQHVVDLAIGMIVDDLDDDVGEVISGFDVAELTCLDQ